MIVTQLSLAEYFDLIVERATYGGYKWVIMFIGRKAEAEKIYNEIENCWASLNDLTNNRIAFVFSASIHIRDNSFYKFPHQEPYRGRMCPFARIVGKDTFRDNVGDFEYLCHHFQSYNWKELQPGESGTITVSYEAEQPGDFYRTVDIYGNLPNNSLMLSFIGTVK